MAQKVKSHLETEGYLTAKSRVIMEDALFDNNSLSGSSGQVLTAGTGGQVVWATPSGGGSIDGTGAANKIAFFTDADTIDDTTLHWDSANGRLGIGTTSPSYDVSINDELDMGGGSFHYDAANKRIGINTIAPTQKLDVAGAARFRNQFYDGSNSTGSSGEILTSTGSATQWKAVEDMGYKTIKTYYQLFSGGSSGTTYWLQHGNGAGFSLGNDTLFLAPTAGELVRLSVTMSASYSGVTLTFVNQSGTSLYTTGSTNYTGNTPQHFTPSSATFSQGDRIGFKTVRGTAPFSIKSTITAVFKFD